MDSFLDAMVRSRQLKRTTYKKWYKRFTTELTPGVAPWDPWLCSEWNKKPRETFADFADYYNDDAWVVQQVRMLPAWIIEEVPLKPFLKPGMKVLDFGAGHGRDGIGCLQSCADIDVTFAEISPRLLKGIKNFCKAHDRKVTTLQITEEIPQIKGEYDIIICKDVLEHVKYPIQVLESLLQSLKVGGIIWLTVFFNGHELSPYHLPEHYHLDNPTTWGDICLDRGLRKIEGTNRFLEKIIR